MSKDITIEKVGVPQELNGVKKIITNSPDFFQATWIPEESTKPLGKLTVHRNGHYEASDFYAYGFDEVEVDVPQTPPEIEGIIDWDIPPIDIDFPDIDINIDDFNIGDIDDFEVIIDVPNVDIEMPDTEIEIPEFPTDLAGITHIDENGNIIGITKQDLEDMGKSMEDIAAMEDPVITIDDLGNIDIVDSFGVDDFGGVEVIDLAIGDVDLKIDGIDDDGRTIFTDEKYLPTSIELTVPPNKLVYHDGEPIDLTGAIVSAKYRGGTAVWANEKYPNGIIPLGELSTSVTDGGSGGGLMPDEYLAPLKRPFNTAKNAYYTYKLRDASGEKEFYFTETQTANGDAKLFLFMEPDTHHGLAVTDSTIWTVAASKKEDSFYRTSGGSSGQTIPLSDEMTYLGKTVYWNGCGSGVERSGVSEISPNSQILNEECDAYHKRIAWAMIYDNGEGQKTVTISWPRPKDGMVLTTTFEITMDDESNDSNIS